MPASALRRLIARHHPHASVRALERAAGVAPQTLGRWLKPGTRLARLPDPRAIREVATVLGVPVAEVVAAFNASLPDPLPLHLLPDDEAALLADYARMPAATRRSLRLVAEALDTRAQASS